nr:YiiD C-terminal domain-containing protein [Chitinophagaceae bacterium]
MRVLDLPFTKRLGITKSELKPYLLRLQFSNENTNHIGTIHGSASYSLAEITSGYFLNTNFADIADDTLPILRNASIKYKKSCVSILYSKAKLIDTTLDDILLQLKFKRKCHATIEVRLYDPENTLISISEFEWFITMQKSKA